MNDRAVEIEVEVRYAETDQMGVVHHATYPVWFEVARTRLCSRTGYHYADIERMGYLLLVTRLELRYLMPARYGDTVSVRCWMEDMRSRSLAFAYRVHRDGRELVTGRTEHLWLEAATRRPCRIPEVLRDPFARLSPRPAGR